MAGEFCDWAPCMWLQRLLATMMPRDRAIDSVQVLVLGPPTKNSGRAGELKRVTLYYCPFCGTRLSENKEILEWIQNKRG